MRVCARDVNNAPLITREPEGAAAPSTASRRADGAVPKEKGGEVEDAAAAVVASVVGDEDSPKENGGETGR